MLKLTPNPHPNYTGHAAQQSLVGYLGNGATWTETITLVDQNGDQVTGVGSDSFQLSLKQYREDQAADLTLSGSQLTVTVGATTTLAILATQSVISGLEGDYICDIVSKNAAGTVLTHRAHGRVTVYPDPIEF